MDKGCKGLRQYEHFAYKVEVSQFFMISCRCLSFFYECTLRPIHYGM